MEQNRSTARGSIHAQSFDNRSAARHAVPRRTHARREAPRRYIPSLDGLRAFAVVAVIAYHLGLPFMQSGLLGVTVFFVLSGYLITGLLLKERRETGTINLPQFWLRRIRRLFPAIVTVIVVMAALFTLFNHELLTKMRPDTIPALFWFSNWWYIFHDVSYFQALGSPSPLTHFWSLAIEEQFYVVWPLVLLGLFRVGGGTDFLRRGCMVLAILSALAMALLYDPAGDPSRVYYGTDTRAFSLLVGAWLACLWPGAQFTQQSTRNVSERAVAVLDIVGGAALVAILAAMVLVGTYSPLLYYGGIFVISVLTAVVIAALVHPRSRLAKVMESKPLVWVGKRSYAMYLWHFPLILLLSPLARAPGTSGAYPWWFCILVFALTFAISAFSFRFIEDPIRHGALGEFFKQVRSGAVQIPGYLAQHAVPALAFVAVFAVAGVGYAAVPDTSLVPEDAIKSTGSDAASGIDVSAMLSQNGSEGSSGKNASSDSPSSDSSGSKSSSSSSSGKKPKEQDPTKPSVTQKHVEGVVNPLLIGDSVPGMLESTWNADFPYGLLDSYVGRWPFQAQEVYADYVAQGVVGHVIVLPTFSNHLVPTEQIEELVGSIGADKAVYLVNVVSNDDWVPEANALLAACAQAHENVHLIDWAATCAGHEAEYLYDDGLHLTPEGAAAYQAMIKAAIISELAPEDVVVSASPESDEAAA